MTKYREPNAEYSRLLKDPRWRSIAQKIKARDGFKCALCGNSIAGLETHHLTYFSGTDPWDYSEKMLRTLCPMCHDLEHEFWDSASVEDRNELANEGVLFRHVVGDSIEPTAANWSLYRGFFFQRHAIAALHEKGAEFDFETYTYILDGQVFSVFGKQL